MVGILGFDGEGDVTIERAVEESRERGFGSEFGVVDVGDGVVKLELRAWAIDWAIGENG